MERKVVWIDLTEKQLKKLEPIFRLARAATKNGINGAILAQPFSEDQTCNKPVAIPGKMKVAFIDHDTTIKINAILHGR